MASDKKFRDMSLDEQVEFLMDYFDAKLMRIVIPFGSLLSEHEKMHITEILGGGRYMQPC